VSEILRHLGFEPHQEALGVTRGGVVRLETIVSSPPDFLIVDPDALVDIDHGSALLAHPALARAVPSARRLLLPNRLSICGGPSTPMLIRSLAAQAAAAKR
jgi:iron complex transport system substrate-binding protein